MADYVGRCPMCGRNLYLGDSDICERCENKLATEEREAEQQMDRMDIEKEVEREREET